MKSRARSLADKSLDAMLAAVEIYNKPSFAYREESFAILAINAWELILKARILQLDQNRLSAILMYERRRKADGTLSEKLYRKRTRSGAHQSLGLFAAHDRLINDYHDTIPPQIRENLVLLCEIRDNAVHFLNKGFDIARLVQEIGTAALKNYLLIVQRWFAIDLREYNFFLMPLAFVGHPTQAEAVPLNAEERRVVDFLQARIASDATTAQDGYSVSLAVKVRFMRSKDPEAHRVVVTNDPTATRVTLTEEDVRERYPWDYKILTKRLQARYSDFSQNQRYHTLRKPLEGDRKYCVKRYLDPAKRQGVGKCFYNPNILVEFDKHYTRKPK
jgi:hypothetical protein